MGKFDFAASKSLPLKVGSVPLSSGVLGLFNQRRAASLPIKFDTSFGSIQDAPVSGAANSFEESDPSSSLKSISSMDASYSSSLRSLSSIDDLDAEAMMHGEVVNGSVVSACSNDQGTFPFVASPAAVPSTHFAAALMAGLASIDVNSDSDDDTRTFGSIQDAPVSDAANSFEESDPSSSLKSLSSIDDLDAEAMMHGEVINGSVVSACSNDQVTFPFVASPAAVPSTHFAAALMAGLASIDVNSDSDDDTRTLQDDESPETTEEIVEIGVFLFEEGEPEEIKSEPASGSETESSDDEQQEPYTFVTTGPVLCLGQSIAESPVEVETTRPASAPCIMRPVALDPNSPFPRVKPSESKRRPASAPPAVASSAVIHEVASSLPDANEAVNISSSFVPGAPRIWSLTQHKASQVVLDEGLRHGYGL